MSIWKAGVGFLLHADMSNVPVLWERFISSVVTPFFFLFFFKISSKYGAQGFCLFFLNANALKTEIDSKGNEIIILLQFIFVALG